MKTSFFHRITPYACSIAITLSVLTLSGCAPVTMSLQSRDASLRELQQDVLTTGKLSLRSTQVVRMRGLDELYRVDPAQAITKLDQPDDPIEEQERILTVIEACLEQALLEEKRGDRAASFQWYLRAGERAYDSLFSPTASDSSPDYRYTRLRLYYSQAIEGAVFQMAMMHQKPSWDWNQELGGQNYIGTLSSGENLFQITDFDEIRLASRLVFDGLVNRHIRFGVGVPLVGYRATREEPESTIPFKQPVGIATPITAVLFYDPPESTDQGMVRNVRLALLNPVAHESITMGGRSYQLAADYTAAFGYMASKVRAKSINFAETFAPELGLQRTGFYLTERYNPEKIPLITVHGLLSSPLTWVNLQNDLLGDPEIRKRYQVFSYYYPPGLPIAESSMTFRKKLTELFHYLDPNNTNNKLKQSVIIAHSMGGLLTRTVVCDSGESLWLKFFGKTMAEVPVSEAAKHELDATLRFSHRPYLKRVIFVAVPHLGSDMALGTIGWIGRSLITLPARLVNKFAGIVKQVGAQMDPAIRESLEKEPPTSISGLSPSNPFVQVLGSLPIAPGIPYHSIIGDEGRGDTPNSSDGVVPYWSSHLEGAESELIVAAGHSAHVDPLAVREIKRILRLHLAERNERLLAVN